MAKMQDSTAPLTQDQTQTQKTAAELVPVSKCCTVQSYTSKVTNQVVLGVKLHNLKFLAARLDENGNPQSARFSGLLESFTDPVTGEVRGQNKDSVPLRFFGKAAEQLSVIMQGLDPVHDSIILACNGSPDELTLSIYRDETGRATGAGASTREFLGNHRVIAAAPEAKIQSE